MCVVIHEEKEEEQIKKETHFWVHSLTAWPAPLNSAKTSMPSSWITVLSTSKHTASACNSLRWASAGVRCGTGPDDGVERQRRASRADRWCGAAAWCRRKLLTTGRNLIFVEEGEEDLITYY